MFCFLYLNEKKKTDLMTQKNDPNGASHEKSCSEIRRSMVETGRFYIKLFMSIYIEKNSFHPAWVFSHGLFFYITFFPTSIQH